MPAPWLNAKLNSVTNKWEFLVGDSWVNLDGPKITDVDTAIYTALDSDDLLHVSYTTTGSVSIVIPENRTRNLIVKDGGNNAGTNNIVISTFGSEKIEGVDTISLNGNSDSVSLYKKTNWFIY